jgi:protein-S-isoprenylcysteine O-methyltransferase Ste14
MTMYFGSPLAYVTIIPFFLFVYQAIIAAEEAYLRGKFGREYDEYATSVNRYIPAPSRVREAFAGMRFDWQKSIRKDFGTVVGLGIGLVLIPVWRVYFLHGPAPARAAAMRAVWLIFGLGVLYLLVWRSKKAWSTAERERRLKRK